LVTPPTGQIQHSNFLGLYLQGLHPALTAFKLKILKLGSNPAVIFDLEAAGDSCRKPHSFFVTA